MKTIRNIKNSVAEIAQVLATNEKIQRLLSVDTSDALENEDFSALTFDEMLAEKYISFAPTENALCDIGRNTFLIIVMTDGDLVERASGVIYIGTDADHLSLTKNRFRLLELLDIIARILDGKKISTAGEVSLSSFSQAIFSEVTWGYKIFWSIQDLPNEGAGL